MGYRELSGIESTQQCDMMRTEQVMIGRSKTNGQLAHLLDSRVVLLRKLLRSKHPLPTLASCSLPLGVVGR